MAAGPLLVGAGQFGILQLESFTGSTGVVEKGHGLGFRAGATSLWPAGGWRPGSSMWQLGCAWDCRGLVLRGQEGNQAEACSRL